MKQMYRVLLMLVMMLFVTTSAFAATTEKTAATTPEVSTEAPTTEAPTTEAPTTEAPTTEAVSPELMQTTQAAKTAAKEDVAKKEVKILHTNDMHGRLLEEPERTIGMAKVKTIKDQENPTLMLDSGDAFQGLPLSNYSKGADMAAAMNAVGYDAMTVGNHEFDFGFDQAMAYKKLLNFPIISSNIVKEGKSVYDKSAIITKDGIRFGVIGVTTPETATKTHPNNIKGVSFLDPVKSVTEEMTALKDKVDTYVILSHLGIDKTTKEEWRGDFLTKAISSNPLFKNRSIVVLDGHSHSVLENGEVINHAFLNQTGTALNNIGEVTYTVDGSKMASKLIHAADTADITPDTTVKALAEESKAKFDQATSKVVFHNNEKFVGEREMVRTQETNLGNAVADAMEAYAKNGFKEQADFAFTNGGGIRASIDGDKDATIGDIINVLPFGNTITQIKVKGSDIKAMFEHSLSAPVTEGALEPNGAFLQVSKSIKVHYDLTKPSGKRVYAIEIMDPKTKKFKLLDPKKTYNVVTNDFTAIGGDGYTMLGGEREEGPSLDTVFAAYLENADLSPYAMNEKSRLLAGDSAVGLPMEEEAANQANDPKEGTDISEDTEVAVSEEELNTLPDGQTESDPKEGTNIDADTEVAVSEEESFELPTMDTKAPVVQLSTGTDAAETTDAVEASDDTLPMTGEHQAPIAGIVLLGGAYLVYRSRKAA